MEATKDHISLETAKLLKDCGVESKYIFQPSIAGCYNGIYETSGGFAFLPGEKAQLKPEYSYPAFTWGEILWEYAGEFFGKKTISTDLFFENLNRYSQRAYECHGEVILHLLQKKKYDEADEMFKETCVLINNK